MNENIEERRLEELILHEGVSERNNLHSLFPRDKMDKKNVQQDRISSGLIFA